MVLRAIGGVPDTMGQQTEAAPFLSEEVPN